MTDDNHRWVLTWFTPEGWREIARGRSRVRAAFALFICTCARPGERHNLRWRG